ncbi:hypothetical protein [Streptomyces sasae]|uniref:hypothetical protein n=1 Tax=Streptomyces sasae TaxID=1266772 RepID=UPI00292E51B5|nr:hypothetical protein [Streptomyces sasae]
MSAVPTSSGCPEAAEVQWQIDMLLGFAVGEILESPDKDDYSSTHSLLPSV